MTLLAEMKKVREKNEEKLNVKTSLKLVQSKRRYIKY
jgi:hypothetical protein